MRKAFIIFIAFFFLCGLARAQRPAEGSIITDDDLSDTTNSGVDKDITGDTSITFRDAFISTDKVKAWRNKKNYAWIKNIDSMLATQEPIIKRQGAGDGVVQRTKEESADNNNNSSSPQPMSGKFKIILWILAGALVVFIIYNLFLSKGVFNSGGAKLSKATMPEDETQEDISDKDYRGLLRREYDAGNFKFAARYLFLLTLQKLQEKELIVFSADKTNSIYVNELPPEKRNNFARLALYYEYIWYGNAHVNREIFDTVEKKYTDFLNLLG